MVRLAERVTKGPLQKDGPWRLHLFGVTPDYRDADGGYPLGLDYSLDQSHGLIADGSTRGEEDTVHPLSV